VEQASSLHKLRSMNISSFEYHPSSTTPQVLWNWLSPFALIKQRQKEESKE
jgi:hypothetical protein